MLALRFKYTSNTHFICTQLHWSSSEHDAKVENINKLQKIVFTFLLGLPCCFVAKQEITLQGIVGIFRSNENVRYKSVPHHSVIDFTRISSHRLLGQDIGNTDDF